MKKSIPVRILTALGGLVLLAACAGLVAEGFFGVPVLDAMSSLLASEAAWAVLVKIIGALMLAALAGAAVVCALPAKPPKQTGSIMQKGENGPIGITVGAICKMVLACADKHPEIIRADVDVREARDGLVVLMNVEQVGGVSIPLSVARLQKQVREYINGRTGLDVMEVRVMVDNESDDHVPSEFEVEDRIMASTAVRTAEYAPEGSVPAEPLSEQLRQIAEMTAQPLQAEMSAAPEAEAASAQPPIPADTADLDALLPEVPQAVPEMVDDAEKPLHQRVFGAEEAPMTVPMPPEMAAEPADALPEEDVTSPAAAPEEPETACVPEADEDWTDASMQEAALELLSGEAEEMSGEPAEEAADSEAEEMSGEPAEEAADGEAEAAEMSGDAAQDASAEAREEEIVEEEKPAELM